MLESDARSVEHFQDDTQLLEKGARGCGENQILSTEHEIFLQVHGVY